MQLTRSIAASHGKRGVRCNAVAPGLTLTDKVRARVPAHHLELVEEETLTPGLAEPEDVAAAVAFLASDEARHINGHVLVVDGGTASHMPGLARLRET
jgi:NAD(P)-dependent dehydrogenase (short-subunit alcohol dehydrogenase family)